MNSSLLSRKKYYGQNFQFTGDGDGGNGEGRGKTNPKVFETNLMRICKFDSYNPGRLVCTKQFDITNINQQRVTNDSTMNFDRNNWNNSEDPRSDSNQCKSIFK